MLRQGEKPGVETLGIPRKGALDFHLRKVNFLTALFFGRSVWRTANVSDSMHRKTNGKDGRLGLVVGEAQMSFLLSVFFKNQNSFLFHFLTTSIPSPFASYPINCFLPLVRALDRLRRCLLKGHLEETLLVINA